MAIRIKRQPLAFCLRKQCLLRSFSVVGCVLMLGCGVFCASVFAQDGKALFQQKCASCHGIDRDLTGPALKGMLERVGGDKQLLFSWIRNSPQVLASGNKYYNDLYNKWNKAQMSTFQSLSDAEIEAINTYVETWEPPVKKKTAASQESDDGYNYIVWAVVLVLSLVVFFLYLNPTLQKLADQATGFGGVRVVPFYRKKTNIAFAVFVFGIVVGYVFTDIGVSVGRDQDYMPRQPIFFSHKVHAGLNQIQCMFCHTGVDNGKSANIPSLQTCMTCHMAIDEYKGEDLQDAEGNLVDGTAEIHKLYRYVNWNAQKKRYDGPASPIEWVRIHILPDHVYFSHENHVVNAKLACEQCHGDVSKMDEMKQHADLSMGWCVNCHRHTDVQFNDNAYYQMFEHLHEELKKGTIKSVNADMVGANECQKCHY